MITMTDRRQRAIKIVDILQEAYPDAPKTYLAYTNAFELLIATILSAHTTDRIVNLVTPSLFEKYPDVTALAKASIEDIKEIIRPVGTYNRKAVYLKETAIAIVERFNGKIPTTISELVTLKGVSRKTANVVISTAFGINEGIIVDTHILRVTTRLGLCDKDNPKQVEKELMGILPQSMWHTYAILIGTHGRKECTARKPKCETCVINDLCINRIK